MLGVSFPEAGTRQEWVERLASRLDCVRVVDSAEVDADLIQVLVVGNPPGESLQGFGSLRFIQSTWAGVDRLVEGAPSVPIARMVAPELTELMTEFVLAAVLSLHRLFPAYRRDQSRREWRPRPTVAARQRRVGVLGFGELGRPSARALSEAGFEVMAWARTPRPDPIRVVAGEDGFHRLLGRSDIVVDLLPLTPQTRGILDQAALARLPAGASLVNVARGAHVVEGDLLEALDSGHLSDAVLDVFDQEPLGPDHPFWSHERVTVLPHVAAPSNPDDLAPRVAANIERFIEGGTPRFLVESG